jgi:hypothetical protein
MKTFDDQRAPTIINRLRRYFPDVNRVADATKPLQFEVFEKDVDGALEKAHDRCAVAQACKRQEKVDAVAIFSSTAYLIKGDLAIRYRVPTSVTTEIVCFDRAKKFQPGVYQLSAIGPSDRMDAIHKRSKQRTSHGNGGSAPKPKFLVKHHTQGIRTMPKAHDAV